MRVLNKCKLITLVRMVLVLLTYSIGIIYSTMRS